MKTSKPISTISYNSEAFLKNKINEWKQQGFIEFGMWIKHEPEEDEKKAHFHVYLKPAQLLQTTDLETYSCEIDPKNPDKPFKMIMFRSSNESDWVLYGIHDPDYLAKKGLIKQYHYNLSDIQCTDEDTLTDIISHVAEGRKGDLQTRIIDCINMGMTWQQICFSGMIPLRYINQAKTLYMGITDNR